MKYALISTIDVEQPYRFCEISEFKFNVAEPQLFWVDCPENATPETHTYTDQGFVEILHDQSMQSNCKHKAIVNLQEAHTLFNNISSNTPTVL